MAEYSIEPWGETRADVRNAIVAMTMANIWRGKSQKRLKLDDFMPKFDGDGRITDVRQMEAIFKTIARTGQQRAKRKGKARANDQ